MASGEVVTLTKIPSGSIPKGPYLTILRQHALAIETVSRNGIQKRVHVVVKNHPFSMQVSLCNGGEYNLRKHSLEVKLLYDIDDPKEVAFVKEKPISAHFHLNDGGNQVTVELRIKVLTSQLEDSLFRVEFNVVDLVTKKPISNIRCIRSESIRVVSKPEQVKKKPAPKMLTISKKAPTSKKKEECDSVFDSLARIESTCLQQQLLLSKMCTDFKTLSSLAEQISSEKRKPEGKREKDKEKQRFSSPFENAFNQFLEAYNDLSPSEKARKIRRVSRDCSHQNKQTLTELLTNLGQEGIEEKTPFHIETLETECSCDECPHKKELEKIDEFYNEFLSVPFVQ